jgi:hypothetical protein
MILLSFVLADGRRSDDKPDRVRAGAHRGGQILGRAWRRRDAACGIHRHTLRVMEAGKRQHGLAGGSRRQLHYLADVGVAVGDAGDVDGACATTTMGCLLLALRTNLVAEGIRQTVVAAESSLADSRVLDSFTRVDPDDAAPALHR